MFSPVFFKSNNNRNDENLSGKELNRSRQKSVQGIQGAEYRGGKYMRFIRFNFFSLLKFFVF